MMSILEHGISIDKETGEFGIITAYLPDMKIFAVWWNKGKGWWTYETNEEDFNRRMHVVLFDAEEEY